MNRRQFLAAVPASLLLAGCGNDGSGTSGDGGGGDNSTPTPGPADQSGGETPSPTPEPTPTDSPTPEPTPTDSPTPNPTPTNSPTPIDTGTPEPAQFEVVEWLVPDSVKVDEMHSYGLKIRNTGGQAGTFVGELEVSRKQLDEWRESATLNIGPLEPGETGTEERPFAYSEPMTVQFRLTDFDAQTTYEVVRPTMESP